VVIGYVVMPEHVHLLVTEPQRDTLSTAIQALKLGFVRSLEGSPVPRSRKSGETWGHPRVKTVLAKPLLRFQRLDGREADRETPIHPSKSGQARIGYLTRTVAVEQLSLVFVGRERPGEDQRHRHSRHDDSVQVGLDSTSGNVNSSGCPMSRRLCETWERIHVL
jgi:hypothetical protein